jgi:phosphoribosyl-ATP pyrophosphohydrolase
MNTLMKVPYHCVTLTPIWEKALLIWWNTFPAPISKAIKHAWVKGSNKDLLRTVLIKEEYAEVLAATEAPEMLKELADLVYVTYGFAATFGWDLDEAVRRVHASNMSKLGEDGQPIYREDGKVSKGPNYEEPNLTDLV